MPLSQLSRRSMLAAIAAAAALFTPFSYSRAQTPALRESSLDRAPVGKVQLGGELGRRMNLAMRENYLALDLDGDFLRTFRNRKPKEEVSRLDRFTGLGMLLLAAVTFAESGDPQLVARKNYLVEETLKVQSPSGYIGAYSEEPGGKQLWTEYCFHDAAYIAYGLAEDYRAFRNERSLRGAQQLIDYLMASWPTRPPGNYFTSLGAAEALLSLYELTGEKRYLEFVSTQPMGRRHRIVPAPLSSWLQDLHPPRPLSRQEFEAQPARIRWKTETVHIYRTIDTAMMQLKLDRFAPNETLLQMAQRLVSGMTRRPKTAMLITGATGKEEVWHEDQDGSGHIGETCATVYSVWFFDELLRRGGDLRYGDLMERAVYNALFAAQDPKGRRLRYYVPFSGKREYFERDTYCCPNNFRRGISSLPRLIYYQSGNKVAVNLYTTSATQLQLSGGIKLNIAQTTDFPTGGDVTITLAPSTPTRFALALRIPRWCPKLTVRVNGSATKASPAGSPLEISRKWKSGDVVRLHLPLQPRWVKGTEKQDGRAALLRGPLLYGLNPSRNAGLDKLDLRAITVDPRSTQGPIPDNTVRPGGTMFRVKAWSSGRSTKEPPDLSLILSEFVDPDNEEIYFPLSHPETAQDDELFGEPTLNVAQLSNKSSQY